MENVSKNVAKCVALLESHTERLKRIEHKLNVLPKIQFEEDEIKLPLTTIEQIQELEENIDQESVKISLIQLLSRVDGKDDRFCTFRCLSKIFSIDLSPKCGWTNRNNNFPIKNLNIIKIIKDSVRKNFGGMTEQQFENSVKDWFRAAHQRQIRSTVKDQQT